MLRSATLGLGILCAMTGKVLAAEPSITNVTLGMSLAEVKQAIGPGFELQDHGRSPDGAEQHWLEVKPFEGYSILILNDHLIYLDHYQRFTLETKPSQSATIESLLAKYGPVTATFGPTALFWAYDAYGGVIHLKSSLETHALMTCNGNDAAIVFQMPLNADKTPYQGSGGVSLSYPSGASSNCPVTLRALATVDGGMSLQVEMFDQHPLYVYLRAIKLKREAAQKTIEAGNKPRL